MDRINGMGTCWYPNGNKYEGQWLNGKIHGAGTLTMANGDKYSGEWREGKRHGQGVYYYRFACLFTFDTLMYCSSLFGTL